MYTKFGSFVNKKFFSWYSGRYILHRCEGTIFFQDVIKTWLPWIYLEGIIVFFESSNKRS
jgi:hypothetical protein